jgi:hypothetical protein
MSDRFLKAYIVELRLLVMHWSYPLLHVLLIALLLYFTDGGEYGRTALGTLETLAGRLAIGLISLVGLFAAGLGASRADRAKAAELEWTFPTGEEVVVGRWLAGVTALLGFLLEPLIVATRQGPLSSLLAGLPTYTGEAALTIAFTTAGAWWLARRIPLGRWSYPLLAAGWLAFLVGPTLFINRFPYLSLFNFMRQGVMSYHSELWRRLGYGDALLWFNLFYAGLMLFFLGLLMWWERFRRSRRPSVSGVLVAIGALAMALFAGANYVAPILAIVAETPTTAPPPPAPAVTGLVIEAYDLTLNLSEGDRADFEAAVSMHNQGEVPLHRFDLQLHPTLQVTEADAAFEREGVRVWFDLPEPLAPGERRTLRMRYGGPVWEAYLDEGVPVAEAFVHPDGVRLSPIVVWYPEVPGESALRYASSEPFDFRLVVEGTGDLRFGSNLPAVGPNVFESGDATWVYLVGSPFLVTEEAGDTLLITARDDLPRVRPMISVYTEALAHLRRFMPDVPVEGLTAMVLQPGLLPQGTPPSDGRAVVVIGRLVLYDLNDPDAYNFPMVWDALLYDLWRLGGGALEGDVAWHVREAAAFIWMHYGCDGDPACIAKEMEPTLANMGVEWSKNYLPAILLEIYEQEGEDAIVRILREFRLRSETFSQMPREEILTWLRESAYGH